jgi:hypothetical protein
LGLEERAVMEEAGRLEGFFFCFLFFRLRTTDGVDSQREGCS